MMTARPGVTPFAVSSSEAFFTVATTSSATFLPSIISAISLPDRCGWRLPPRGEDGAGYSTLRREQRALLRRGFFTLRQEEISRAEAAMLRIVYRSLVREVLDGFAELAQAAADLVDRRVGALVDI